MSNRRRTGLCPRCFNVAQLTKHHCLPKRFFGKNHYVVFLCDDCHNEIEKIIPMAIRLSVDLYLFLNKSFIMGEEITATIKQLPVKELKEGRCNNGRVFEFPGNKQSKVLTAS